MFSVGVAVARKYEGEETGLRVPQKGKIQKHVMLCMACLCIGYCVWYVVFTYAAPHKQPQWPSLANCVDATA